MKKDAKPYVGTVKVGPKGQIVIPKEIREMFDIDFGDSMIIFAHPQKGIALERQNVMIKIAEAIFSGKGNEVYPEYNENDLKVFAQKISDAPDEDEEI